MTRVQLANLASVAQCFVGKERPYQEAVDLGHIAEWWRTAFLKLAKRKGVACHTCYGINDSEVTSLCEGCQCAVEDEIGDSMFGDS